MIIFPYNTDAPIYYRPIVTIIMIVINTLIFVLQCSQPDLFETLCLEVGDGIHPAQWLTCNFMHGDPMHLIGNMIFLWSFGLIVEGKIGPWKMLSLYFGIAVVFGASTQIFLLNSDYGRALGASAVIYGLMTICLVWAPLNCMDCIMIIVFRFIIRTVYFEVYILVMVGLYLGLDILFLILKGGAFSSELGHTMGALVGLIVGVAMLKTNLVDCEYWDVFSVLVGRHRLTPEERQKIEDDKPEVKKRKEEEHQKQHALLESEINRAIRAKHAVPALRLCERMKRSFPDWQLGETELLLFIQLLENQGYKDEFLGAMKEYLVRFTAKSSLVRLKLAKYYLEAGNNRIALKILQEINLTSLDSRQKELLARFQKLAYHKNETDIYGLAEED